MWAAKAIILLTACLSIEAKARKVKSHWENEVETDFELQQGIQDPYANIQIDPCTKKRCKHGQECRISEEGKAKCVCVSSCPDETDFRRKVCSSKNETWSSDCELAQMRCWCKTQDERCTNPDITHHHIDYFGPCKESEECTPDQMADFPRRMKEWLSNIMRDMAETGSLSEYYRNLEETTIGNFTRRWNAAAVWKFCDLDKTNDRSISRHELFPIRAPLVSLEHCIAPFLTSCDANDDHLISLTEWLTCLELSEDDLEDECENLRYEEEDEE